MNSIELYINGTLCDTGPDFSVRLNRVLTKPGELNTKDAQYSYSVSLPPTPTNHAAFNYANIEETRDKFNREYNAELIVNGVRIFIGKFRLSEIGRLSYKGNLYVPSMPGIKGVFGDMKMNGAPEWRLEFKDFAQWMSKYNTDARNAPQPAIFPYTLYGLLPKVPDDNGDYTARNEWDKTVRIGLDDFPPSVNALLLIRRLFEGKGYKIGGTAFDDGRLAQLYMSYKNDPSYVQPWNYGRHAQIRIEGRWSNVYNRRSIDGSVSYERDVFWSTPDGDELYACDLFDCRNSQITVSFDPGGNVEHEEDSTRSSALVRIPVSGYYKIELNAEVELLQDAKIPYHQNVGGVNHVRANAGGGAFYNIRSELKLLRDNGQGDFGVMSSRMDGKWYYDNMRQDKDTVPRYMPNYYGDHIGSLVFVDTAQNANFVSGLQWGDRYDSDRNPAFPGSSGSQVQAAKPAVSWDASRAGERLTRLAIDNPAGYWRYGVPDTEEGEGTPVWSDDGTYRIVLQNAPENKADRTTFTAEGSVNCVVWLERGELLTLVDVSDKGAIGESITKKRGWVSKSVDFRLSITPFRADSDWLQVDTTGKGTGNMNWNDEATFYPDHIDLAKFLPADMKIDDFLDNFCKAFNLTLTQTDTNSFELNLKQTRSAASQDSINFDNMASVRDRTNTPLGLPSMYKLGFTVDTDEEGYMMTKDDGGGEFRTGATEEKIVEQKSTFSYNWFKDIQKYEYEGEDIVEVITLPLAVISNSDVWATTPGMTYQEAMGKRYTGQALRFWYYNGLLNDLGASFLFNNYDLSIAKVSNELPGLSILNYKNQPLTILQTYFTVLVNSGSHYTELEGYLTPVQYELLGGSAAAIFNGDVYTIAEVSGYDPTGRNKTKVKLIRR